MLFLFSIGLVAISGLSFYFDFPFIYLCLGLLSLLFLLQIFKYFLRVFALLLVLFVVFLSLDARSFNHFKAISDVAYFSYVENLDSLSVLELKNRRSIYSRRFYFLTQTHLSENLWFSFLSEIELFFLDDILSSLRLHLE